MAHLGHKLTAGINLSFRRSAAVERLTEDDCSAAESLEVGCTGTGATAHKSLNLSLSIPLLSPFGKGGGETGIQMGIYGQSLTCSKPMPQGIIENEILEFTFFFSMAHVGVRFGLNAQHANASLPTLADRRWSSEASGAVTLPMGRI